MTNRLAILISLAVTALGPAIALAQSPPERDGLATLTAIETTLTDVIDQVEPTVVAVARFTPPKQPANAEVVIIPFNDLRQFESPQTDPPALSAGVIIDPAGLVLTEFLAVREGDVHTVTTIDGVRHRAEIRAADPRSGLAILALQPLAASPTQRAGNSDQENAPTPPNTFPAIRFGDAAQLRKGQFVIAIGNPYAIQTDGSPTASWGTVTNLARKAAPGTNLNDAPGPAQDYRTTLHHLGTLIQTDAKLGWSAGGGALVNLRGALVGLTTTAATIAGHEQPAGYAIPINTTFRRIINTLKEGREVEYGLLGVSLLPTSDNRGQRVLVQHAYAGSPGDRAGLASGDVITRVDGRRVDVVDALQLAVSALPPSSTTTIDYERGGKQATAKVTLAKLGVAGSKVVTNRPPAWRGIHVDYATALDAGALGLAIESSALDPAGCVLVSEVEPDSSAWRDGIRPDMFISHIGSERVTTPEEFYQAIQGADDSLDIRLTQPIERPGEKVENNGGGQIPDIRPPQP